ncbi:RHS repeat-associated core domain-containing protein [Glaciecola siphonariae]|uniref:RHS repeat-associated core domain-containing protein n=1 Tax=Glaciecola siphonariae TaxID=521012 RepID=A0ABV9LYA3_9ALTE
MNGRIYDYNIGRFLSVDPFIQGTGSQGINPYSYVLNNPLSFTDPTGYSAEEEVETKPIYEIKTGSRLRTKVGETTTTTVTNDLGQVTHQHSVSAYTNGTYAGSSVTFDNGKATSATVYKGNKDGKSVSATVDINSPTSVSKDSSSSEQSNDTISLRAVSASDSNGNSYSWNSQRMYPGSPVSMEGAMRGAHNSGKGYDAWVEAGGSSSAWDHPLVMMGGSFATEGILAIRFGSSIAPGVKSYSPKLYEYFGRHFDEISNGFSKLVGRDRKQFLSETASAACGIAIVCASKFSPFKLPPGMPANPPAWNNGINYLHRQHDKTIPYPMRILDKVD